MQPDKTAQIEQSMPAYSNKAVILKSEAAKTTTPELKIHKPS